MILKHDRVKVNTRYNKPFKMKKTIIILFTIVLFLPACGNNRKSKTIISSSDTDSKQVIVEKTKPIVNVYVENSGSMFGYIRNGNDFDRSISSLYTSIKVSDFSDSINLFYINSRTFKENADISTFIRNTNIHNTTNWPGDLTRTDMCTLFDMVTSAVNNNVISIFVSDCIFSPGNEDANKYIGAQKDCITLMINQKLKRLNMAFVIHRLLSSFQGNYFDCEDRPTQINGVRPFYIWVVGSREIIAEFNQKVSKDKIEGQLKNSFTIFKSDSKTSYAVQLGPKIGDFERTSPTSIKKTKKDNDSGRFMFSVAVDFSALLVDDSYLIKPHNYFISNPNYSIEILKKPMGKHTHLIKINSTAKIISPTKLTIQLKNIIPKWVDEFSDESCANIKSEGMMQKTYGLKQIVQGVYAAYNYEDDVLAEISININQNQ